MSLVRMALGSYLLDNCPSLFLPEVKRAPEPRFPFCYCSNFNNHVNKNFIGSWPLPLTVSLFFFWQAPEQDEVLQSIDRAIEGIHNVALKNGGKYNLEQRDVLQ